MKEYFFQPIVRYRPIGTMNAHKIRVKLDDPSTIDR